MKKNKKEFSIRLEEEVYEALSIYSSSKKLKPSASVRAIIIACLKNNRYLRADFQDKIKHGGDRLKDKLETATPEEQKRIKGIYDRRAARARAAKMRAAKRAKHAAIADNNSGIIIAGDNLGNIDNSQKNFNPKKGKRA